MAQVQVVLFDVNETLLDMAALDPHFARAFGDRAVRRTWFAQVLQLFMTATIIGEYRPFDALADDALTMVADGRGTAIADADRAAIRAAIGSLPPHADVVPALTRLRDAGLRTAALTNSTEAVARKQLTQAGLSALLDPILSVDAARRYKPAPESYAAAAAALGVAVAEIRLVATHSWDVGGARAAGCRTAFVARPGQALDPGAPRPEIVESSLAAVADRIIALDAPTTPARRSVQR